MNAPTNTIQFCVAPSHSTYLSFIETGKNYAVALIFFLLSPFGIIAQDTLLGLTSNGGSQGRGTAFSIKNNGTDFSIIKAFADWGKNPNGDLVQGSDGNFYGMTYAGGTYSYGTIFKVTAAGAITILHHFNSGPDGANPYGELAKGSDGNFYGMTSVGGTNTYGTIFKITPSGTFTVIHHMAPVDGTNPHAHLIQASDGLFYGTTSRGGAFGYGTIFKVTSAGALTVLRSLNNVPDGGYCYGSLVEGTDGYFYGITNQGGTINGPGTIFKINSAGGSYTVLHNMVSSTDGGFSEGDLIQANDGNFYGTAYWGGTNNLGTIFKITAGGNFSVIRRLSVADGTHPNSALVQGTDGLLYGLGSENADHGYGSVFKITTAGAFTKLYAFSAGTDGGNPNGSLIQGTDGNFYGMTSVLGSSTNGGTVLHGTGTIFKISSTGAFSVLTRFNGGIDGNAPLKSLLQSPIDNAYYGTTSTGGAFDYGTVFKLCGGSYTVLHSFDRTPDGATPRGSLVMGTDSNFYGMTSDGGAHGVGTIFKITPNGNYTVIRHLTFNTDGQNPEGSLVLGGDGYLYGVTASGGLTGNGTIFKISQNGASFTVLRTLTSATDGANPRGDLVRGTDTNFYGMTSSVGHIFKIGPGGSFTSLHTFSGNDGNSAVGSLVLASDGNFYGMCSSGGLNSAGTIFKMTPAGNYTVLRALTTATDGSAPKGNLIEGSDGNLYGMTSTGAANGGGSIFKITKGGTFTVLKDLNLLIDGGNPFGSLIKLVNNLVANPQSVTLKEDTIKKITLTGSGGAPLVFTVTVKPKHGSVSGSGAVKKYKPKPNFNGKDSFAFTVSIGCLSSPPAEVQITVTPVPDSPVLAPIGNKTVVKNSLLTFTVTATDADKGDKLTFSLIGAPAGATIDSVTGVFKWTAMTAGSYSFMVRVTDNGTQKLYDEEQITVTVTNSLLQVNAMSIETMTGKLADTTLAPTLQNSNTAVNSENLMRQNTTGVQILVYPTIVQNSVNISVKKSSENIQTMSVTMVDGDGKAVWRREKINFQSQQLSLPHLSSGVYMMLIEYGANSYNQRVIVGE